MPERERLLARALTPSGATGSAYGVFWLALAVIVMLPGPLIAIGFLLFVSPPVSDTVYAVHAGLYALLLLPLVLTTSTLLYLDLARRPTASGTDQ